MITPKELLEKATKSFFRIVSSHLKGESVFPWIVSSNKSINGSNYTDWKNDLVPLHQQSKEARGMGYTVEWKQKIVNSSKQSVPAKIYFETFEDYLYFTSRRKDFVKIEKAFEILQTEFPSLGSWARNNPALLLAHAEV